MTRCQVIFFRYGATVLAQDNASKAARLRLALQMADAGIAMKRQQLARRHPEASPAEVDAMLRAWLGERPLAGCGREMSFEAWSARDQ
ncbi:hypothetical protein [Lujinxingia vulgaris]|uniref:hypothetical protein n=1 Tax=Lujinxingia vulgaris TaxID=2600176 RepID=UPI0024C02A59|nr:hypothetical protein [Lujinxingia vulgaris]